MTESSQSKNDPEMLNEYDFSGGVRGKYAGRFVPGANVVVLDPDVAEVFPDSKSVNAALRALPGLFSSRRRGQIHKSIQDFCKEKQNIIRETFK